MGKKNGLVLMASSIILGNSNNVSAVFVLLVLVCYAQTIKHGSILGEESIFTRKACFFFYWLHHEVYSISTVPTPSPSPTSQGSQYLAILPSVCMSHGWTNMEQPSSSAACKEDTLQDQYISRWMRTWRLNTKECHAPQNEVSVNTCNYYHQEHHAHI